MNPDIHLITSDRGRHLFVVDGSQLFDVDPATYDELDAASRRDDRTAVARLLEELGVVRPPPPDAASVAQDGIHAISLAVAQTCNLACRYCYADEGTFGGGAQLMSQETAASAVDLLCDGAPAGARLNLAFLGGEPLINRSVLRAATERAAERAAARGLSITFSVTTNGTLLDRSDAEFFERHGFAVTISLDGLRDAHDLLRPFKHGAGSYDAILARVMPLLAAQRRMQVSARVTVTPSNLDLLSTLREFVDRGFHSVGFSPVLSAPSGAGEMNAGNLTRMLAEMIACGREFERQIAAGSRFPFANMVNAVRELHRGTHRPYPCGAAAGYFGVSADGTMSACHRFVGNEHGRMGSLSSGIDAGRRTLWLTERHVDRQQPCQSCWARYLCGGGCHHEVLTRGRVACDYIRGWLQYCLGAYVRLLEQCPGYFATSASI
jgi:uncharacterized protein